MPIYRGLPPEVRALSGVAFMVALGFGLVAPALPLFASEFGVGKAAAGAVVSVFALMRLLVAPFVGRLVNAFGERMLLATGIGLFAAIPADMFYNYFNTRIEAYGVRSDGFRAELINGISRQLDKGA